MTRVGATVALAAAALCACEPGGDKTKDDPAAKPPAGTGRTEQGSGGDSLKYVKIELEDDLNNATLNPCDAGALKTPGADIDAGGLYHGDPGTEPSKDGFFAEVVCSVLDPCGAGGDPERVIGEPDGKGAVIGPGGHVIVKFGREIEPGDHVEIHVLATAPGGGQQGRYAVSVGNDKSPSSGGWILIGTGSGTAAYEVPE